MNDDHKIPTLPEALTSPPPPAGEANVHTPALDSADPQAFANNLVALLSDSNRLFAELITQADLTMRPFTTTGEMAEAAKSLGELSRDWMADPQRVAEAQTKLAADYAELWARTMRRMAGEEVEPVVPTPAGDGRFKDPDWSSNPYFDYWKQMYLITSSWAEKMLDDTPGLDERQRQKAAFYLRLVTSALSPSNFPATNPEVLRETIATNGENLRRGMENFTHDVERSRETLKISQVDTEAFEVGRNVATTPGKVVFQNDLLQLIQYTPATHEVFQSPILLVPPWINKFYILDLNPQKSLVRHLVAQGFTVFVISWVNPDERLGAKTFEDYMKEGVLTAADVITVETGEAKINVLGYCVGGTLLATSLAYLAARGDDCFRSATFLTTQVDFTKAGDLLNFIDEEQLAVIDTMMQTKGYLDGSVMAGVFNMMRPRDMIWPYVVNNYLMGKKPTAFDLLFWNQDSTRMPAANHAFYLRKFYLENLLAKGEMTLGGVKLDLGKVKVPIYDLAARDDHIAPAESALIGSRLFGGPVEYVLAGSGHIAGVINPPSADKPKYQYWTNPSGKASSVAEFIAGATETKGSWWPHWTAWLAGHSGVKVPARTPGATLGTIEDAPGSYVKVKG